MLDQMNSVINTIIQPQGTPPPNQTKPFEVDGFGVLLDITNGQHAMQPLTKNDVEMIAEDMTMETQKLPETSPASSLNFRASNVDSTYVMEIVKDDKVIQTIPNEKIREMVVNMQEHIKGGKDLGVMIDMLV